MCAYDLSQNLKFEGVLPLLYFAWVEVSNVNTAIEQMASCPWTRMPDEVLTLPDSFPLPAPPQCNFKKSEIWAAAA